MPRTISLLLVVVLLLAAGAGVAWLLSGGGGTGAPGPRGLGDDPTAQQDAEDPDTPAPNRRAADGPQRCRYCA